MAVNPHPNNMLNFVVKEGNRVNGFVETGLSKVPEQYTQEAHEQIASNKNIDGPAPQFPVIDLLGIDGPQHDEVLEALVTAAKDFGFIQVVNHGISLDVQDALRYFFNQPAEKKMVYNKGVSPSPWVTYDMTPASDVEKAFEWVETIYNVEDDEEVFKYWSEPCKEVVLKYIKASTELAKRTLQFLMRNVGATLDNSETETYMGGKMITMNFYPKCPEPDLAIAQGRHSDISTLTVLLQDDVGGLFVKLENDGDAEQEETWAEIKPIAGALLILVGDSLEILSNGQYKSPEHWVRTSHVKSRYSIPIFLAPILSAKIGPLPEVAEKDGGPRYKEIMYSEYLGLVHTESTPRKQSMKVALPCET